MSKFSLLKQLTFPILIFSSSCKMLPNTIRSGTSETNVAELMDPGSIQFTRSADGKSGTLSFTMKEQHECRIEYWADDPSGTPAPSAPIVRDCSKTELKLTPSLALSNLTPGIPLSFRIYVWPRTLNFLSSYVASFREGQDLDGVSSSNLVVVRYSVPRNSNEIYTYQFAGTTSLATIKAGLTPASTTPCEENPKDEALPFPRFRSLEDATKRPLHGLSEVTSDGYARGQAQPHPFFTSRLVQTFESTTKQETWKWSFQWEGKDHSFESHAPGALATLSLGSNSTLLRNRSLNNTLADVEAGAQSPVFNPSIIFPSDIARYIVTVKSEDASQTLLRCQFPIDQAKVQIPNALYGKFGEGSYVVSFALETSQIHFREQGDYPPWIITAQDFVQFKLNKRL